MRGHHPRQTKEAKDNAHKKQKQKKKKTWQATLHACAAGGAVRAIKTRRSGVSIFAGEKVGGAAFDQLIALSDCPALYATVTVLKNAF